MGLLDVLKVILYLTGFCALLFLTYVTTRYIGRKQVKAMKSKNINVLETVMLGIDKRLHLVKAGNSYLLIATTPKSVVFLSTVDIEESEENEESEEEKEVRFDFKSIFEKYAGIYKIKKEKNENQEYDFPQGMVEEKKFKSNLARLRTIVNRSHYQEKENGDEDTNEKEKQGK
ncbi:MAG: flagellar biosynthetic protein FliO [Bacillota bacterium]